MPQNPRPLDPGSSPLASFGALLREHRTRRGLSQRELGGLAHISGDLVGRFEKAERRPRFEIIDDLDGILDADGDLRRAYLGLLSLTSPTGPVERSPKRSAENVITYLDVAGLRPAPTAVPISDLATAVDTAWMHYQRSQFRHVCRLAPALLTGARQAVLAGEGVSSRGAYRFLALTHHVLAASLAKLGDLPLAHVSADLGLRAARYTEDPLTLAALRRCVAHTVLSSGDTETAVDVVDVAVRELSAVSGSSPELDSLRGSLHLVGAMAAARAGSAADAAAHLSTAERAASQLGRDGNFWWTAFGPSNTASHRFSVAVELGHLAAAASTTVPTAGMPLERRTRYGLERARLAHALTHRDAAIDQVLALEQRAGLHVRRHVITRALVRDWTQEPHRTARRDLQAMLSRMVHDDLRIGVPSTSRQRFAGLTGSVR